jgi:hypothetical protein
MQTNECTLIFNLLEFINFLLYCHLFQNNSTYQLYPLLHIRIRIRRTSFYSIIIISVYASIYIEVFQTFIGNMIVKKIKLGPNINIYSTKLNEYIPYRNILFNSF